MNMSAFRDLCPRVVFLKVLKTLRTFKTSLVTIDPEMQEHVHTIFYLLYIQQNYYFDDSSSSSCSRSYSSVFAFSFLPVVCVCQTFNQVCVVFKVFLFFSHFFQVAQRCFGLIKQTDCPPFFFISCTNFALPQCFHGNFRIALYNLYLHSITYLCIRH